MAPEKLRDFLTPLPVERLWGVGRVTLARMHNCNIKTVGDLARRDPAELKSMFGTMGPHLHELASGHDWLAGDRRLAGASRMARKTLSRTTSRSARLNCAAC